MNFHTKYLPSLPDEVAPDGSDVRVLLGLESGAMSHFVFEAGNISSAVLHKTVKEIWFILTGSGEMWRRYGETEKVVSLEPGVCLTIPLNTCFQVRSLGNKDLSLVAVTMPPWPGDQEACLVEGKWKPTIP